MFMLVFFVPMKFVITPIKRYFIESPVPIILIELRFISIAQFPFFNHWVLC